MRSLIDAELQAGLERLLLARDVSKLLHLEQMRQDFVANVSHELRTPLTVIAGYLETLLDNVEEVNPRWRRALQQMQQQDRRMQTLLNDLLLLAKLEATDYPSDNQPVAVDLLLLSIIVAFLIVIGLGVQAFRQVPVDAFPDVTPIQVNVYTESPGLAAEDVEKLLTAPIEGALAGLPTPSLSPAPRNGAL